MTAPALRHFMPVEKQNTLRDNKTVLFAETNIKVPLQSMVHVPQILVVVNEIY